MTHLLDGLFLLEQWRSFNIDLILTRQKQAFIKKFNFFCQKKYSSVLAVDLDVCHFVDVANAVIHHMDSG